MPAPASTSQQARPSPPPAPVTRATCPASTIALLRRQPTSAEILGLLAGRFAHNLFDLSGKTAVVTGGARGVGRLCAEGLLDHGASVVITSRDSEAGEAARRELSVRGP